MSPSDIKMPTYYFKVLEIAGAPRRAVLSVITSTGLLTGRWVVPTINRFCAGSQNKAKNDNHSSRRVLCMVKLNSDMADKFLLNLFMS